MTKKEFCGTTVQLWHANVTYSTNIAQTRWTNEPFPSHLKKKKTFSHIGNSITETHFKSSGKKTLGILLPAFFIWCIHISVERFSVSYCVSPQHTQRHTCKTMMRAERAVRLVHDSYLRKSKLQMINPDTTSGACSFWFPYNPFWIIHRTTCV